MVRHALVGFGALIGIIVIIFVILAGLTPPQD